MNRREFTHSALASSVFAVAALQTHTSGARILGANDRINLGFVGVANRGGQLLTAFDLNAPRSEVTAVCDIDSQTLGKVSQRYNNRPFATPEYRKLLDRTDVDGVVIATPDHWHALQTVWACEAGKDVYVEKPLCATIYEGRKMVQAARKHSRIVQVGTHRRSSTHYIDLAKQGADNLVGFVTVGRSCRLSNMYPDGIGRSRASSPPECLDWDTWLGPRAAREFQDNIAPYKFRWWQDYSSQMGNWGVHYLDAMRWLIGETAPISVCAMGGRYAVDDDRTVPDTAIAMFEFKSGRLLTFSQFEACGNPILATNDRYRQLGEFELRGTNGTLYLSDANWEIRPETGGQFAPRKQRMEPKTGPGTPLQEVERLHALNFLDCMVSRQLPNADVEIGHRSTSMSLMANISLELRQRLDWDPEKEQFINNDVANQRLHYEYRKPYSL